MSVLHLDNNLRLKSRHGGESDRSKERFHSSSSRWSTVPKTPSNLVKSNKVPSFSTHNTAASTTSSGEMIVYDRHKLMEFLSERETTLFKTRDEYEEQFENFFSLAKRFHTEKLNNLKLVFKNQILKQQIYFETELLELSKECMRDYELSGNSKTVSSRRMYSSKKQSKIDKYEKEKQIVKLFKSDMKKLLDYMREALINSSETLIEAYETCHILKTLETIENNFQKQHMQMKFTTSNLVRKDASESSLELEENKDEDLTELNKQLSEEQIMFDTYKEEMDDLMHTLDDIELQHLQRKDQLTTKTKFFNKLKNKFKFIESKYDKLNKKIADLKYESYIFKRLCEEKRHVSSNREQQTETASNARIECNLYTKQSSVLSSADLSTSSSSRSSSTSSLSDCVGDIISSNNENETPSSEESCSKSSSSSSSSSLSHQDISELLTGSEQLDFEDVLEHNVFESDTTSKSEYDEDLPNLSMVDYNRKLCLINELIRLHKSKMSDKDLWSMSSENETTAEAAAQQQQHPSLNNFTKANIKYFNLKNEEEQDAVDLETQKSICYKELGEISSAIENNLVLYNVKQESSLILSDVSIDGDRVCVDNCNLKANQDVSDWFITRQIDDMPVTTYKLPRGSVISAGKCLRIDMPFVNDQLNYLRAIKNQERRKGEYLYSSDLKKAFLKIRTRLIGADGALKDMHTQEIPQFYHEIFKYASLIKFL